MKIRILFFFLLISSLSFSATKYWVGGSGTWDASTTTNWANFSGGAGGQTAPTSSDDVVFDSNSGLSSSTVTVASGAVCNNFTWSATVGTISVGSNLTISGDFSWSGAGGATSGFSDIYIAGNATFNASMTIGSTNYFYFNSTTTDKTITTNGKSLTTCYFSGVGGSWTTSGAFTSTGTVYCNAGTLNLGNTLSSSGLYTGGGTFNSNNYSITLTSTLTGSSGTLNLGSSAISITPSSTAINFTSATINAGTSVITINSSSTSYSSPIDVSLGLKTIYNLVVSSSVNMVRFFDGGTINNLTFNSGQTAIYESAKTFIVNGTLSATGSCTNYVNFISKYDGSAATISVGSAQSISYIQMKDITKSGAGSIACDYCVNAGTNTSITFTNTYVSRNLYWRSGTSGSWSSASNWTTNSNGSSSGNTCLPTFVDNIYFNSNAITSSSQTITIDKPIFCNNLDFTGLVNSPTWSNNTNNYPMFITGNYTMSSGMGTFNNGGRVYFNGNGNQLIKTAGKYLTSHFVLFYGSGTYFAEDDLYLSNASDMLLTKGTLSARNNANTVTYNLYLTGSWRQNDESFGAGASFTYSTSTVNLNGSYSSDLKNGGSTVSFYNVTVNKSSSTIKVYTYDNVTINNQLLISSGNYYNWLSYTTNISASGTVSVNGTNATLEVSSGVFNFNDNSTSNFSVSQGTIKVSGGTLNVGVANTHTSTVLNVGNTSGSGDASLLVTSGTLNITDKLLVNSDGIFNVSGGTTNIKTTTNSVGSIGNKFQVLGDFRQSSGTVNVLGAYDNTSTNPAIDFSSSSINAANITGGTVVLQSTTTGVTTGYYVNWGGKTIFNLTNSTSGATYTQLSNALVLKGSMTINTGVTYVASNLALSIAANWTNSGTFTPGTNTVTFNGTSILTTGGNGAGKTFYNVTLNGTSATLLGNIDIDNAFTITSGTWDVSASNYSMNVGGNWSNSGTFTPRSGTVTCDGSSGVAQTIGGTNSSSFYNATINNTSGGVALGINTTVSNTLTLTNGKLTTQGYTLSVGTGSSNGSITGGNTNSYIVAYYDGSTYGILKRFVNTAASTVYTLPIGDASNYTPANFTLTSASLSSASITTFTRATYIPTMSSTITKYVNRYWDITPTGITSPTYTIDYTYVTGDLIGSPTSLIPVKKSGTTWYKPTGSSATNGTTEGSGTWFAGSKLLSWSGLTTFSLFGGVEDQATALPIELLSFQAKPASSFVDVKWQTASEQNNDYFELERSENGIDFQLISTINGAGNSVKLLNYGYEDFQFVKSINYYRLKQVDFDGNYSYSAIIAVDMSKKSDALLLRTINSLGQIVDERYDGFVLDIYSDGTSVKRIQ